MPRASGREWLLAADVPPRRPVPLQGKQAGREKVSVLGFVGNRSCRAAQRMTASRRCLYFRATCGDGRSPLCRCAAARREEEKEREKHPDDHNLRSRRQRCRYTGRGRKRVRALRAVSANPAHRSRRASDFDRAGRPPWTKRFLSLLVSLSCFFLQILFSRLETADVRLSRA